MVVPMGEVACLSGGVREKPRCQGHLVSTGLQAPVGPRGALSGPGKHLRPDLLSSRELVAQTQEKDKDSCRPYPSPLERRSLGGIGASEREAGGAEPTGGESLVRWQRSCFWGHSRRRGQVAWGPSVFRAAEQSFLLRTSRLLAQECQPILAVADERHVADTL